VLFKCKGKNIMMNCSKTWLIKKSGDQKNVFFLIVKKLYNSEFFCFLYSANNLLEKLVLLLFVQYVVACHAISVTIYHLTWCSVVINVIFNAVKPLSIISEGTAKNKQWLQENDSCGQVTYFKLCGENCFKIITTGQVFLTNCDL
jgi:hypothetical protein